MLIGAGLADRGNGRRAGGRITEIVRQRGGLVEGSEPQPASISPAAEPSDLISMLFISRL